MVQQWCVTYFECATEMVRTAPNHLTVQAVRARNEMTINEKTAQLSGECKSVHLSVFAVQHFSIEQVTLSPPTT